MISLHRPSVDELSRIVSEQERCQLTYPEHGATDGTMPAGYHHDRWEADLGSFEQARFDHLAAALYRWQAQLGAGLTIFPAEPVRPGLTFAFAFRLPAASVVAAGRVVYVTTDPDRRGFAYGTLPGHPESGEEAWMLDQSHDG